MMRQFDTEYFINEIKKRRSIYDTTFTLRSFQYLSNRERRKRDWDDIVKIFGGDSMSQSEKHILGFQLKNRWKNIRTCFARELKRQKNYGSGVDRKSEYKYFKHLMFLKNFMNIAEREDEEESNVEDEPKYMHYDDKSDTEQSSIGSNYKPELKCKVTYSNIDKDEDCLFLLSLLSTLKRVPKNKKMDVKIKMLSILNETLR